jgi:hypothetical protein
MALVTKRDVHEAFLSSSSSFFFFFFAWAKYVSQDSLHVSFMHH